MTEDHEQVIIDEVPQVAVAPELATSEAVPLTAELPDQPTSDTSPTVPVGRQFLTEEEVKAARQAGVEKLHCGQGLYVTFRKNDAMSFHCRRRIKGKDKMTRIAISPPTTFSEVIDLIARRDEEAQRDHSRKLTKALPKKIKPFFNAPSMPKNVRRKKTTRTTFSTWSAIGDFLCLVRDTSGIDSEIRLFLQLQLLLPMAWGDLLDTQLDSFDFERSLWHRPRPVDGRKLRSYDRGYFVEVPNVVFALLAPVRDWHNAQLKAKVKNSDDGAFLFPKLRALSKNKRRLKFGEAIGERMYFYSVDWAEFRECFVLLAKEDSQYRAPFIRAMAKNAHSKYHDADYAIQRRALMEWWADALYKQADKAFDKSPAGKHVLEQDRQAAINQKFNLS